MSCNNVQNRSTNIMGIEENSAASPDPSIHEVPDDALSGLDQLFLRDRAQETARFVEQRFGIRFDVVPETFYPGMLLITPTRLSHSKVTSLSLRQIMRHIRAGRVPVHRLGRRVFLDGAGVEEIKLLEQSGGTPDSQ